MSDATQIAAASGPVATTAGTGITIISQGELVAASLSAYLKRHPEMDAKCTKNSSIRYFTTESVDKFSSSASIFLNEAIVAEHLDID